MPVAHGPDLVLFVPGPRLSPRWHLSGTVPQIHTVMYTPRKTRDPLHFFLVGHTVSGRESETTEDPFQQTPAQILQSAVRALTHLGAHVIASSYRQRRNPWNCLGKFKALGCHHLTHPSHTQVPDSVETQRMYAHYAEVRTTLLSGPYVTFRLGFALSASAHSARGNRGPCRAGDCHIRRYNKPCSRSGLRRMYRDRSRQGLNYNINIMQAAIGPGLRASSHHTNLC